MPQADTEFGHAHPVGRAPAHRALIPEAVESVASGRSPGSRPGWLAVASATDRAGVHRLRPDLPPRPRSDREHRRRWRAAYSCGYSSGMRKGKRQKSKGRRAPGPPLSFSLLTFAFPAPDSLFTPDDAGDLKRCGKSEPQGRARSRRRNGRAGDSHRRQRDRGAPSCPHEIACAFRGKPCGAHQVAVHLTGGFPPFGERPHHQ